MNMTSPYEELEAAKLSAAFCELATEMIPEDCRADGDGCDAAYERLLKQLKRDIRREKLRAAVRKLWRFAAIAAAVAAVLSIASGFVIADDGRIMAKVISMIVDTSQIEDYIRFETSPEAAIIDMPADWNIPFYHTYIPEGFHSVEGLIFPGFCNINYYNSKMEYLQFMYRDIHNMSVNISSTDAEVSEVRINDDIAKLIHVNRDSKDEYTFVWFEGDTMISLTAICEWEEALKVAESIQPVNIIK